MTPNNDLAARMQAHFFSEGKRVLPYRLYVPADYDPERAYRLVLMLHGAGERGSDNLRHVTRGYGFLEHTVPNPAYASDTIFVAPQCAEGERWVECDWSRGEYIPDAELSPRLALVTRLLRALGEEFHIDAERVYAVGVSMGGMGIWDLLARFPRRFAAAGIVCGAPAPSRIDALCETPIWTANDPRDTTVLSAPTARLAAELAARGADVVYKTYTAADDPHASWTNAFCLDDGADNVYRFLFSHSLRQREESGR